MVEQKTSGKDSRQKKTHFSRIFPFFGFNVLWKESKINGGSHSKILSSQIGKKTLREYILNVKIRIYPYTFWLLFIIRIFILNIKIRIYPYTNILNVKIRIYSYIFIFLFYISESVFLLIYSLYHISFLFRVFLLFYNYIFSFPFSFYSIKQGKKKILPFFSTFSSIKQSQNHLIFYSFSFLSLSLLFTFVPLTSTPLGYVWIDEM